MKRLIEKGLMFGNLVEVSSPALVERYNRALQHLAGKQTKLNEFHIDISGFSPQIGHELGDPQYLNPNGCNRQFILLTTEQRTAPLLNMQFSTSREIMRQFIEANEAALFALTARDAVAGELANTVFEVSIPERLLAIRRITVEADTTGAHVADAHELNAKIAQFREEDDAWFDDVLIAKMIGLAKKTGDVTRNPVTLPRMEFETPNFWTRHFGGLYVFRSTDESGVIHMADDDDPFEDLPVDRVMAREDANKIARFLSDNDLVEPIVKARGADAAAILRQKMDFMLVDVAATLGQDLKGATRRDLRNIARQLGSALPPAFHGLGDLLRWVETGGKWPRITSEHPAFFYTLRATAGPTRDLVNMLLAELTPLDVRQLFICHKELFYGLYAGWSDAKKSYVADFLEAEYQVDKAGARAALFGSEPGMAETSDTPSPWDEPKGRAHQIELVGPWGAVRKERD